MRILLYVPLAPQTPRIYARTIMSIFAMDWPHALPVVFGRNDTPHERKYVDLAIKHNEARRMVLAGGYDGVLFVENDMIVPPDALRRLTAVDADVAYGLYVGRHGWNRWLAFYDVDGYGGVSFSQDEGRMRDAWGNVRATDGIGMGCTLIWRHVLEAIEFRTVDGDAVADDWLFSLDCMAQGFRQAHNFGVVCGHMTPKGTVYWPDPDAPGAYRVEHIGGAHMRPITPAEPLVVPVGMETVVVHGRSENDASLRHQISG